MPATVWRRGAPTARAKHRIERSEVYDDRRQPNIPNATATKAVSKVDGSGTAEMLPKPAGGARVWTRMLSITKVALASVLLDRPIVKLLFFWSSTVPRFPKAFAL